MIGTGFILPIFIFFWIIGAVLIVKEQHIHRLLVTLGIFSCISFACYLLLASPDVAMAQAVISVFATITFIVAFEKYYKYADRSVIQAKPSMVKFLAPLCFCIVLAAMFIYFIPDYPFATALRDQYVSMFKTDIGGENAVTAIYLGYRLYDTVFEALILLVSIMAVIHLSHYKDLAAPRGMPSEIQNSDIAAVTIRLVCPIMMLLCIFLIANGHISPGGGFQGGVVAASLFVCRYMIHDLYDIPIVQVINFEKFIFVGIVLLGALFIYLSVQTYFPINQTAYLVAMNMLIGLKVACGFLIVFYRFIAFERR
ncbi:MAG: DUF4040 domain-containing protein [Defluviitaleaceae bacterium]|nr:DUF4040 domain-containing protein [Defluviitaleaceae bacterium]